MKKTTILTALVVIIFSNSYISAAQIAKGRITPDGKWQENEQLKKERLTWWSQARFGLFIHWGVYAIPAGVWK
ncbi:MAG: alpha-L-fucosidase, partial [Planctomycetota bacterium]